MASVVFMRAVNVGGHGTFRPSLLAAKLADLGVHSVGAAGTFVVRTALSQSALRSRIQERLPFQAQMMICPARELLDLASRDPFPKGAAAKGAKPYVSIMEMTLRTVPPLPISRPAGEAWAVKVLDVSGRYVLSLGRRLGKKILYPNEVVEKHFQTTATTRNWNTISAIVEALK
jgi:uncharacterized protein (DUF1697 family)